MNQSFSYKHLFYFWIVAKEGGMARASEHLGIALPTISKQVRMLEKDLGVSLLKAQGRNLVLTQAGVAAMREADLIFSLGEQLPYQVREAISGRVIRLNVGISDGIAKMAVHRVLAPILSEPHLRLLCHEGEFQSLLGELGMYKLDLVLSDRPAAPHPGLKITSRLLAKSPLAWYAPPSLVSKMDAAYPQSLSSVPMLLPTTHSAIRLKIDHWFEREHITPKIVGEFEDSALLATFSSEGMGIFPGPAALKDTLKKTYGLSKVADFPEVEEQFHLIYTARKVLHPLLVKLLSIVQAAQPL
jgi:LysR family transcriptional regulator, transcriptional activator of nhaA